MRSNESIIELSNVEIFEHCILDTKHNKKKFNRKKKKILEFTGLYYKSEEIFFAVYPTENGPTMYFKGKEYPLTYDLHIELKKDDRGEERVFSIEEYDICIKYKASPYIGFDVWSKEEDVDLFYQITRNYKNEDYHKKFTK